MDQEVPQFEEEEEITFCFTLLKKQLKIECVYCTALALNGDASMLIESHSDEINIYELKDDDIRKIQRIQTEEVMRMRIYCMKHSQQFVCCGPNNSLQIWTQQEDNMFHMNIVIQNAHTNWITQIIMNSVEDLLISSATDNSIRFWNRKLEQLQILECHTRAVSCISLNKSQNQLVSCGEDNQIVISKFNGVWKVEQIIKVNEPLDTIGFFGDDLILFQYQLNGNLNIYQKREEFEFLKIIDIGVNDLYRKQILAIQEPILLIQNDMEVIVMSKLKNENDFMIQQKIEVNSDDLRCGLRNQILVLWDDGTQLVKIRKYNEYKI